MMEFSKFRGQRVLVTGASGFIGRHLLPSLAASGAEVHAVSRSRQSTSTVWPRPLDLRDSKAVQRAVLAIRPDVVFHLAGWVTGDERIDQLRPTLEHNLLATIHLLSAVHEVGCQRFVALASAEEPRGGDAPTSPYAAAKAAGTLYAQLFQRTYDLPVVVLRLFFGYGPGQPHQKLIPYAIRRCLAGQTITLKQPDRECDFVYVVDVVAALLAAAVVDEAVGKIVDVGVGRAIALRSVVDVILELTNRSVPIEHHPTEPCRRGDTKSVADAAASERLLGWRANCTLRDGLLATVRWHRETKGAFLGTC